jgi:hypothetical protein
MTSIIHTSGLVMTKSEPHQKKAVDRPGPTRAQVVVPVSYCLEKEIAPKKKKNITNPQTMSRPPIWHIEVLQL